jgi:hypothetical protein
MHGTFFDIGLGAGLAAACGLRPFLPLLLAGALASGGDLEVSFARSPFRFLQSHWWLLAVAVVLALAYALQLGLRLAPTSDSRAVGARGLAGSPLAAALTGLGMGAGAVVFAGTLDAHHDVWWPALIGGILLAGLAQIVAEPLIAGARARLADRAAREALTIYLDIAALLAAALVALLHPLGYVLIALLAWFASRRRARSAEKYAGLRVLRR